MIPTIKQLVLLPFNWLVYLASMFMHRNSHKWVFIGWRRNKEREIFAENPKYLFLYVAQKTPNIQPIWISKDKKLCKVLQDRGYESYYRGSLQGIWHQLTAGYTFIGALMTMYNWRLSGRSKVVQLWHGKSLKKTGFNSPYGLTRYNKILFPHLFVKFHKFVTISKYLAEFVESDFHIEKNRILVTGIPKYDVLIKSIKDADIDLDTELNVIIDNARKKKPNRIILYGPTFRPDGKNAISLIDLKILNKTLTETNDILVLSLHPKFSTRDWMPKEKLSNIVFSQGDKDKYPIMHKFDLLITDYSSLLFDFLFMGKSAILFAPDLEEYKKKMGVYDELWDLVPAHKVFTFEDLLKAVKNTNVQNQTEVTRVRKKLFVFADGNASERITKTLIDVKN